MMRRVDTLSRPIAVGVKWIGLEMPFRVEHAQAIKQEAVVCGCLDKGFNMKIRNIAVGVVVVSVIFAGGVAAVAWRLSAKRWSLVPA